MLSQMLSPMLSPMLSQGGSGRRCMHACVRGWIWTKRGSERRDQFGVFTPFRSEASYRNIYIDYQNELSEGQGLSREDQQGLFFV